MSGIFGLIDPSGPDLGLLEAAAETARYRGSPVVRVEPPVALGAFRRQGDEEPFVDSGRSLLVADARVDAVLPDRAMPGAGTGAEVLEAVLAERGPLGLADVAADFALARYDRTASILTLSRDAFGLRPLYWAHDGRRMGFAADPSVLEALGLVSGELDPEPIAAYLAMHDFGGEATAFQGVRRLVGGGWISFRLDATIGSRGRWFRPESLPTQPPSLESLATELGDALVAAVESRVRGRRTALLLSGGRDSGSVAVALNQAGISATCITETFAPGTPCSEEEEARALARELGHDWSPAPAPERVSESDLREFAAMSGTPLGFPTFTEARALRDAVARSGAQVVLDGEGGDTLFSWAPVAVLDLLRERRVRKALSVAGASRRRWGLAPVLKAAVRATYPRPLPDWLRRFQQSRGVPPWVVGPVPADDGRPAVSSRHYVEMSLRRLGGDPLPELLERLFRLCRAEYASPLLDQRVVRLGVGLPLELRVPVPAPKPLLARAFLGPHDATRRKADFSGYYERLVAAIRQDFPELLGADADASLVKRLGFVRLGELPYAGGGRWHTGELRVVALETWLRDRFGRR